MPCRRPEGRCYDSRALDRAKTSTDDGPKTVLLLAPRGFAARFLMQTAILSTLQEAGVRVVLVTPDGLLPTVGPKGDAESIVVEELRMPSGDTGVGKLSNAVRSIVKVARRAALNGRRSPAFAGRYRRIRKRYTADWPRWVSGPFHLVTTQLLWRSRTLRRSLLRLDVALGLHAGHAEVFDRHRPDLVVGTGLGYYVPDEVVFQEAARRGVPTAALVSNWDNPTTRGYRAVDFDLVVAWSEQMRRTMVDLHDIAPERVKIGGVPHWDLYFSDTELPSREELCEDLGLDPAKRIVFHAAFPPVGNQRPLERIAAVLAEATEAGTLGDDVQLLIRLHPKHMAHDEGDARRPFEQLTQHEGVHINHPEVGGGESLRYEPTAKDARTLGGLLKHCDVLVNIFSTTTLEGFLLDRPVVMAATDAALTRAEDRSRIRDPDRWNDFVHLQPLVDSGAARVAHSSEDLIAHVLAYLADPSLERDKRREIAWLECGPTDGHAGERTAGFLLEQLGLRAPAIKGLEPPRASEPVPEPPPAASPEHLQLALAGLELALQGAFFVRGRPVLGKPRRPRLLFPQLGVWDYGVRSAVGHLQRALPLAGREEGPHPLIAYQASLP